MSRLRLSDQVKCLQQRYEDLREEAANLVRARRVLLLRHALLSAWCDSLSFLQLSMAVQPCQDMEAGQFEQLLQQEVGLLQQLTSTEELLQPDSLAALLQPDVETIAPYTDVMAYVHSTVSKAPVPEAGSMTAEAMGAFIKKTVETVSIKLHQLDGVPPWERPVRMRVVAGLWDRYMHYFVSMIMWGRQDVLEHAHSLNLETLQQDPAAGSHQAAQAAVLVPLLGLSEQQQEMISIGMRLYFDLEHSIHEERKQLQAQMSALDTPDVNSNEDGGHCGSCGSSSSEKLIDRQVQLQKQQSLTNRLQQLLHKEYMLRMAAMGFVVGRLSYEQLSRLAVMSWPYAMRVLFLGTEVMRQWDKLVQQRLQLGL